MKNLLFTFAVMMATCFYLSADGVLTNDVNGSGMIQSPSLSIPLGQEDWPMEGYWMVLVDRFGQENWYELDVDYGGNYTLVMNLLVASCGSRAHIYYCCYGQKYGAPVEDASLIHGYNLKNLLVPYDPSTDDELYFYTTEAGYSYMLTLEKIYDIDTYEILGYNILSVQGSAVGLPAMKGDVDLDFSTDINDVTRLIDHLMNNSVWIDKGNADVDDDGKVGISDVTALIDLILGR